VTGDNTARVFLLLIVLETATWRASDIGRTTYILLRKHNRIAAFQKQLFSTINGSKAVSPYDSGILEAVVLWVESNLFPSAHVRVEFGWMESDEWINTCRTNPRTIDVHSNVYAERTQLMIESTFAPPMMSDVRWSIADDRN
jgi:hypothetical protein